MVNLLAVHKPLRNGLMKFAGISPHSVDIGPGTTISIWVPSETLKPSKNTNKPRKPKPAVVLLHGFAADGVFTWQFQVRSLTKKFSVYVPDLLFFGGSTTNIADRTPTFQAGCLVKALMKLGIKKCTVVGFSYGGFVAFEMARENPEIVEALVVSGSVLAMTDAISKTILTPVTRVGFRSFSEFLLPESVKDAKAVFKIATCMNISWIPDRLYKDYLEVMFTNRKERSELLEAMVITHKNFTIPTFPQRIHLLWGENDQLFRTDLAQNMKEQLGEKATYEGIKKAGHLVHLERPCVYNRCLKRFLDSLYYSKELRKQLGEKVTYEVIKKAGHLVHLERPCVYNRRLKRFLVSLYSDESQQ